MSRRRSSDDQKRGRVAVPSATPAPSPVRPGSPARCPARSAERSKSGSSRLVPVARDPNSQSSAAGTNILAEDSAAAGNSRESAGSPREDRSGGHQPVGRLFCARRMITSRFAPAAESSVAASTARTARTCCTCVVTSGPSKPAIGSPNSFQSLSAFATGASHEVRTARISNGLRDQARLAGSVFNATSQLEALARFVGGRVDLVQVRGLSVARHRLRAGFRQSPCRPSATPRRGRRRGEGVSSRSGRSSRARSC